MYMILIFAVILVFCTLGLLNSRKLVLDKIKNQTYERIDKSLQYSYSSVIDNLKQATSEYVKTLTPPDIGISNTISVDYLLTNKYLTVSDDELEYYNLKNKFVGYVNNGENYSYYLGEEKEYNSFNFKTNGILEVLDYKIYGNSIQEGTNLIKYPYNNTTKDTYGITFTDIGNGTITASGTATKNAEFELTTDFKLKSGTYSTAILPYGVKLYGKYSDGTDHYLVMASSTQKIFQISSDITFSRIYFQVTSATTLDNAVLTPLLVEGRNIDTFDIASPLTPKNINSVGDNGSINIYLSGKNLLDESKYVTTQSTSNGLTWTYSNNKYLVSGTQTSALSYKKIFSNDDYNSLAQNLIDGHTYKIGGQSLSTESNLRYYVFAQIIHDGTTKYYSADVLSTSTFTWHTGDEIYIDMRVYSPDQVLRTVNTEFTPILIDTTLDTDITYEKYVEAITPITLTNPLLSISNYRDYIEYSTQNFSTKIRMINIDLSTLKSQTGNYYSINGFIPDFTTTGKPLFDGSYVNISTAMDLASSYHVSLASMSYLHWMVAASYARIYAPNNYTLGGYFTEYASLYPNGWTFYVVLDSANDTAISLPKIVVRAGVTNLTVNSVIKPSKAYFKIVEKLFEI